MALPAFANRDRNPYNALLYEALQARGAAIQEFDPAAAIPGAIVHVHWPEAHLNHRRWLRAAPRSARRLFELSRARRRGARLVWTVHNIGSHERRYPRTEALFWRRLITLVDGWTALSSDAAAAAIERWPRLASLPQAVIPHGSYRSAYPDAVGRAEARSHLGIAPDVRVVAFIGRIKTYKGVPELVRAFRSLSSDAVLLIAGRVETATLRDEIEQMRDGDARVIVRDDVVPAEELQFYLRAADLVVAPFLDILNSGSVLLALGFDRPVLAPRLGSLPALSDAVGVEWVHLYDPPLRGDDILAALDAGRPNGSPDLSGFAWDAIAAQTESFYREVLLHANASRR